MYLGIKKKHSLKMSDVSSGTRPVFWHMVVCMLNMASTSEDGAQV